MMDPYGKALIETTDVKDRLYFIINKQKYAVDIHNNKEEGNKYIEKEIVIGE